jgi:hypothetical protein
MQAFGKDEDDVDVPTEIPALSSTPIAQFALGEMRLVVITFDGQVLLINEENYSSMF